MKQKYFFSEVYDEGYFIGVSLATENELTLPAYCGPFSSQGVVELHPELFDEWTRAKEKLDRIETEISTKFREQVEKK